MNNLIALPIILIASAFLNAHAQTKPAEPKTGDVKQQAPRPAAPEKSKANTSAETPPSIKSGIWAITTEVNTTVAGSKTPSKAISSSLRCYTPNESNNLQLLIPQQNEPATTCLIQNYKLNKDKATWRLACKGAAGTLNGNGEMKILGDSYTGSVKLQKNTGGKTSALTQKISGKWKEASQCK